MLKLEKIKGKGGGHIMLKINKISSFSAVDYAAEELRKYLRMMMPECGIINRTALGYLINFKHFHFLLKSHRY